jgi:predicted AlkP superfamily pyrophosphatase or phosphodiesterase
MRLLAGCLVVIPALATAAVPEPPRPRNVLLFVADGLRPGMINTQTAPAMTALMKRGVTFSNSHALFPTSTMPNASAMATGHMLGDTGTFGNTIYTGYPVPGAPDTPTPSLESDPVLGDIDEQFRRRLSE